MNKIRCPPNLATAPVSARPSLQRQDSHEPFAKIATTTDDPLSAITPTIGYGPAEQATLPPGGPPPAVRPSDLALSGVRHDHHSLVAHDNQVSRTQSRTHDSDR